MTSNSILSNKINNKSVVFKNLIPNSYNLKIGDKFESDNYLVANFAEIKDTVYKNTITITDVKVQHNNNNIILFTGTFEIFGFNEIEKITGYYIKNINDGQFIEGGEYDSDVSNLETGFNTFSFIDNDTLIVKSTTTSKTYIYAVNYKRI